MKKRSLLLFLTTAFVSFLFAPVPGNAQIPGGPGDGGEDGAPLEAEAVDKSELWEKAKARGRKSVGSATDEPDDSGKINPLELQPEHPN